MKNLWDRIWAANPYLVDGIIGALLAIGSLGDLFGGRGPGHERATDGDALGAVLILVACGVLTWRRRVPYAVLAIASVAHAVYFLRAYPDANVAAALTIAVWTAAKYEPNPRIWLIAGSGLPLVLLASALGNGGADAGDAVGPAITVVMAALFSFNLRLRSQTRVQEARTEQAEADRAVSDERLRIARELHDVVAHAMSIVTVQAGVAAHVIDDQPDEAKRMLENVRVTSHEALDEMRRLLGVLRGDATLTPAPGLRDVDALADSLRTAGIPVTLVVDGTPADVPPGVDLTAYRIVQEALTNVVKHAGPASVEVHIEYLDGTVVVEVTDDGRGGLPGDGGHGLLGMRERVAVFGGELTAGPRSGGGFRVRATLPHRR